MIAFVVNNAAKMSASTFKSQQYDLQVTLHLVFQKTVSKYSDKTKNQSSLKISKKKAKQGVVKITQGSH